MSRRPETEPYTKKETGYAHAVDASHHVTKRAPCADDGRAYAYFRMLRSASGCDVIGLEGGPQ
jgi:hypothetical protein